MVRMEHALLEEVLLDGGHVLERRHLEVLVVCQDEDNVGPAVGLWELGGRCDGGQEGHQASRGEEGSFGPHFRGEW